MGCSKRPDLRRVSLPTTDGSTIILALAHRHKAKGWSS